MTIDPLEVIDQTKALYCAKEFGLFTSKLDGSPDENEAYLDISRGNYRDQFGDPCLYCLAFMTCDGPSLDEETGEEITPWYSNSSEYFSTLEEAYAAMQIRKRGNGFTTSAEIVRKGMFSDLEKSFFRELNNVPIQSTNAIERKASFAVHSIIENWEDTTEIPSQETGPDSPEKSSPGLAR